VKKNHATGPTSKRLPPNAPFVAPSFEESIATAMLQPRATTTRAMMTDNTFCLRTGKPVAIVGCGPAVL
jgi:hypothetical protein